MNILDIRTVLFSTIISNAICVMVMNSLCRQNRRHSPGIDFWLADFIMQFLSIALIIFRGVLPDFISILLGIVLVMGGTLLLYIGLERYLDQPGSQLHNYILLVLFIGVHIYFTFEQPSLQARNINLSLGLLVICAQIAWLTLRRVEENLRPATKSIGVIFVTYSLVSLARIFADLFFPPGNDLFRSNLYDTLVILIYQMLFIGLTFALVLLVNRRQFFKLESEIHERKQAGEALKKSEEKFAKAFQNSPEMILMTALLDGKIIDANESFFRIAEYSPEEALGKSTISLNLWANLTEREHFIELLEKDGRVQNFETLFRKKSGELFTGWISGEMIDLQGLRCILSTINDISERKKAQDSLRETHDYLDSLIGSANAPIITWNPGLKITLFNHAFERLSGYNSAEIVGQELQILFPEASRDQSLLRIARTSEGEHWETVEIPILRKDGGQRIVLWNSGNVYAGDGSTLLATIAQGQDITDRKRQEQEIQTARSELQNLLVKSDQSRIILLNVVEDQKKAQEEVNLLNAELEKRVSDRTAQLQTSNQELEAFAYSVSHDLRAPLRAIDGFSRILEQDFAQNLDSEGKRLFAVILKNTAKMDHLITDILSISRVSRSELKYSPINMTMLANSVFHDIAAPDVQKKYVFSVSDLPEIYADPTLIRQVWTNLISNAIKYTYPKEERIIAISGSEKDGVCSYAIQDNGVGFDPKYSQKLFGLFQRLHSENEFEGTGVGLAIVQRIVHRHGGQVWAQGEPGSGATFYFSIPERQDTSA